MRNDSPVDVPDTINPPFPEDDTVKEEIFLLDPAGERRVFSAPDLAVQLDRCFASAGMSDAGYLAEDIALALEYRLYHYPGREENAELVFRTDEVNEVMCSLLRDLNLSRVEKVFRERNGIVSYYILPDMEAVLRSAETALDGVERNRIEYIAGKVFDALRTLHLSMASEKLMEELAKNFDEELPPERIFSPPSAADRTDGEYLAESTDILGAGEGKMLYFYYENEVVSFSGITRYLPTLRVGIKLMNFAAVENLSAPLLELDLYGRLAKLSESLVELHRAAEKRCPNTEFPVFLHFVDLDRFIQAYFGTGRTRRGGRRDEICREITNSLPFAFEIVIP